MSKECVVIRVDLSDIREADDRSLSEQILSAALWKWEQDKDYGSYFSGGEGKIIPTITPHPLAYRVLRDWESQNTAGLTMMVPLMDDGDYEIRRETTTVTLDRSQLEYYFSDVLGSSAPVWNQLRNMLPTSIMDDAVDARPMKKNDAGVLETVSQYQDRVAAWTKVGDDMFSAQFEVQYVCQISANPQVKGYLVPIWSRWS